MPRRSDGARSIKKPALREAFRDRPSQNGPNKVVTNGYITTYVRNLKLGVSHSW